MESLVQAGVKTVFGYPGGAIMPIYDALYDFMGQIHHVLVRHEQGAVHAAEGYGRKSGRPGVCLATSGPGATNLITGIADALMDSTPIVCITGQVASHLLGSDAFQETDVMGLTSPITKWNYQITRADEVPEVMAKAFYIAQSGRPGPVVIDITKDAQSGACSKQSPATLNLPGFSLPGEPEKSALEAAADLLNQASRPYILAGHGVIIAGAEAELKAVAECAGIPVGLTLHGLSALPADHPLYAGFLGMHGNYGANVLSNQADVVLAVGMRFDDRVTGRLKDYLPKAKVIHIDIDPAEINKSVSASVPIVADVKLALQGLLPRLEPKAHPEWLAEFRRYDAVEVDKVSQRELYPTAGGLTMAEVMRCLSELTRGEATLVADVGQHQMVGARYYRFKKPNSWISSGGMGTMGYAVPGALGVKFAAPNETVIALVGDGGFQMNIQELATIAQEKVPLKMIILNNNFLGMVRQWQELFWDNRYSMVELKNPDFIQVAKGFGVKGERVERREDLSGALGRMLASPEAFLLEAVVEREENVFPMIPSGASVEEIRLE